MQQRLSESAQTPTKARSKPLLRGWLHAGAAVGAVLLTVVLCWLTVGDVPKLISMLIFGLSMIELYTVSAIYHIGSWRDASHRILRAFDHANIFVLIAGTYTPLCFNVLAGSGRALTLSLIWLLALAGIGLSVASIGLPRFTIHLPRMLNTVLYIVMGWVAVLTLPALLAALPWPAIALLIFGGILNTIGGLIYARRWPNPFPNVMGFHEVFHLFVIAGSVTFAAVIWIWALPFPRV